MASSIIDGRCWQFFLPPPDKSTSSHSLWIFINYYHTPRKIHRHWYVLGISRKKPGITALLWRNEWWWLCMCLLCVSTTDTELVNVNVGHCEDNNLILNDTFVWYYQKAYVSMYVICLLVVIVAIFVGRHSPLPLPLCWSSSSSTSSPSLLVVIHPYLSLSVGRHRPLRRHLCWSSFTSPSLTLCWSSSFSTSSPSLLVVIHLSLPLPLCWSSSFSTSLSLPLCCVREESARSDAEISWRPPLTLRRPSHSQQHNHKVSGDLCRQTVQRWPLSYTARRMTPAWSTEPRWWLYHVRTDNRQPLFKRRTPTCVVRRPAKSI